MVQAIGPQTPGTRGPGTIGDRVASGGGFAPIIAILPKQLQTTLVNQLAGQTTAARLIGLSASGLAQIEVRGTPMEVRLKNMPAGQNPGDTVLINFRTEDMPDDPASLTIRGGSVERGASSRNTEALRSDAALPSRSSEAMVNASSDQRLSETGRLLGALSKIESSLQSPFTIEVNAAGEDRFTEGASTASRSGSSLFNNVEGSAAGSVSGTDTVDQAIARYAAQTMADMVKSIENSGLFYEAHLQEWNEGQRTEDDLRNEPQSSWGPEDVLDDGDIPSTDQPRESTRVVASQLGQLERPAMHMTLPGFFNDKVELTIEREQKPSKETRQIPAWFATLRMDLPQLGPLELRVTLLDNQCNVVVKTDEQSRGVVSAAFPELMDAMNAAGLSLNAQAAKRDEGDG
jgi:hypothetical protein